MRPGNCCYLPEPKAEAIDEVMLFPTALLESAQLWGSLI